MKTDIDKNIKIEKNIKKEKDIKMDKNMQAENIHKNVDEITINDFVTKNDKDVLELKKHVLSSGSVVPLLHFKKLNEISMIEHCFTTRLGGISTGMFDSLNLSFTRGDDEEKVLENYKRVAEAIGAEAGQIVTTDQTHTTNVLRVGKKQCGIGVTRKRPYTDVDGLITNEPNVVLATFYADCVPLYFVDPVHRAIGLSHSGWRGTVNRMGKETLIAMNREFGTEAHDVIAAIGPSICQDCYEISQDVAECFVDEFATTDDPHASDILLYKGAGKYQLNLWECNRRVLVEAGVQEDNIAISNICTCCNPSLLFSHRASHGKRGNLGAFMFLK